MNVAITFHSLLLILAHALAELFSSFRRLHVYTVGFVSSLLPFVHSFLGVVFVVRWNIYEESVISYVMLVKLCGKIVLFPQLTLVALLFKPSVLVFYSFCLY